MTDTDTDAENILGGFPAEPDDFYPPSPPATIRKHTLTTPPNETLTLRLVGSSPLWGHTLWNAGVVISKHLEAHASALVRDKTVLELGAGAGLPSLVCGLRGSTKVVVTDYPDAALIRNLRMNVAEAGLEGRVVAEPFLWGNDAGPLLEHITGGNREGQSQEGEEREGNGREGEKDGFDLLLLSDLLFNHSEHLKLAATVGETLKRTKEARALVFFTPHRPWLYEKDLDFFRVVKERGFEATKIVEEVLEAPMFEEDRGDRDLRRTVFGYELKWKDFQETSPDEAAP